MQQFDEFGIDSLDVTHQSEIGLFFFPFEEAPPTPALSPNDLEEREKKIG
jgi:hypothetical protein